MQVLQGAGDTAQSMLTLAAHFDALVDQQVHIRNAERAAILQYTAIFTRTDVRSMSGWIYGPVPLNLQCKHAAHCPLHQA